MQSLLSWYFEKCQISSVLIVGAIAWVTSACLLLGEFAPAVYFGLHLVTTGVFSFAILSVKGSPKPDA